MGLGWFGVGFVDGSGAGERREEERSRVACLLDREGTSLRRWFCEVSTVVTILLNT